MIRRPPRSTRTSPLVPHPTLFLSYQDSLFLPGHDMVPGVFLHVVGAETLKRGTPVDIGWAPAFALAIATLLLTLTTRLQRWFTAIAIATALLLITAKVVLAGMLVTSSIGTSSEAHTSELQSLMRNTYA